MITNGIFQPVRSLSYEMLVCGTSEEKPSVVY